MSVPSFITPSFALVLLLPLSGCAAFGLQTGSQVYKRQQAAYQKGVAAGRVHTVRQEYHRREMEKELPPPPVPKKYYRIPVPAHTNSEGVRVEAHEVTLEIVQP